VEAVMWMQLGEEVDSMPERGRRGREEGGEKRCEGERERE
jgi:hypothetical protein